MNFKETFVLFFVVCRYFYVFGQTTQGIVINNVALPYASEKLVEKPQNNKISEVVQIWDSMNLPVLNANKEKAAQIVSSNTINLDPRSLEEQFFYHILKQENISFDESGSIVEPTKYRPPSGDYEDSIFNSQSSTPWNNFENEQPLLPQFYKEDPVDSTTTVAPSTVESTLTNPKDRQPTDSPPIIVSYRNNDLLKQLKMQFVLDCALLNEKSQTRVPVNVVDLLKATKKPAIAMPQKSQAKKSKPTVKVKNVDAYPPAISNIGDYFESIYNYLEEAFTTKIIEKHKTSKPKQATVNPVYYTPLPYQTTRKLINNNKRRGTRPKNRMPQRTKPFSQRHKPNSKRTVYRPKRTTFPPNSRSTKGSNRIVGSGHNKKNYMTTQIHVTSEYNGPPPTSSIEDNDLVRQENLDSSEEGDVLYDGFAFDDLINGGDDDDSSGESNEDDYDNVNDDYSLPTDKQNAIKRRKNSKAGGMKNRPPYDDYSYEDRDGDGFDLPTGMFGGFFSNFFSTISNMMPTFGWFSGGTKKSDVGQEEARSTTPRIDMRRPKQPHIHNELDNYIGDDSAQQDGVLDSFSGSWFNPFGTGSSEIYEFTTPMTPVTESSDFWDWFGSGEQQSNTEQSTTVRQNETGWFFGLFDNPTNEPTTTRRPFLTIANPLQNPQAWLGILAQHLATTTTRKPSTETAASKRITYDNYQMWRVLPSTEVQVEFLENYRSTPEGSKLQWWKGPTLRGPTDIVIPPLVVADVKESLQYEEIPYEVIIWDVGKAIMYENPKQTNLEKIERTRKQGHPMTWHRYHRYDDIVKFLDYLQQRHSKIVELIHIGRSFEGRPLIIAKISSEDDEFVNWKDGPHFESKKRKSQRPAVFIEAGTHAREWIAPAAATWMLNTLVKDIERNDSLGETLRSVDWYIMPVLNPDGYEFSHEYNRLWRKTRSKHSDETGSLLSVAMNWIRKDKSKEVDNCFGTDPNRNWNYLWNEKGSSRSTCSDFYAGPRAFSEPETKAVSKFLMENKKNFKLFLSLHSYGQLISYPTTANSSYNSMKADDLLEMAQVGVESLRGSGSSSRYNIDSSNEMLFARSGSSDAYAMHDAGIKYSYTLELRDTGTHGFLLPPSYIEATAKEAFQIVRGMIDYM